jgi:hypothetical protein
MKNLEDIPFLEIQKVFEIFDQGKTSFNSGWNNVRLEASLLGRILNSLEVINVKENRDLLTNLAKLLLSVSF